MKKTITIITLYLLLISCNFSGNITYENEVAEKEAAENVTAMFYLFLGRDDFESTLSLVSESFFKVSSKDDLILFLKSKREKLGKYKDFELQDWKTHRVKGTNNETFYLFVYKIKYENGETIEKLKLVREKEGIKINGYDVNKKK